MLEALERYFPRQATWTVPKGGLFLWVQLPEGLPMQQIYQDALLRKVLIGYGAAFFPGQKGYPALRLNFSHKPEDIDRGISELGKLLHQFCTQSIQ